MQQASHDAAYHFPAFSSITLFRLTPQRLDQALELGVCWLNPGQLLGISERGSNISGLATEADQRKQHVAIIWMTCKVLLENIHGLSTASAECSPTA